MQNNFWHACEHTNTNVPQSIKCSHLCNLESITTYFNRKIISVGSKINLAVMSASKFKPQLINKFDLFQMPPHLFVIEWLHIYIYVDVEITLGMRSYKIWNKAHFTQAHRSLPFMIGWTHWFWSGTHLLWGDRVPGTH